MPTWPASAMSRPKCFDGEDIGGIEAEPFDGVMSRVGRRVA